MQCAPDRERVRAPPIWCQRRSSAEYSTYTCQIRDMWDDDDEGPSVGVRVVRATCVA